MTSSIRLPRRLLGLMSPSAHFTASTTLLFPHPLGPTIAVMPSPKSKVVLSTNDLNPWISRRRIFIGLLVFREGSPSPGVRERTPHWIGPPGRRVEGRNLAEGGDGAPEFASSRLLRG